jgi:transcription antitermination factor NusG
MLSIANATAAIDAPMMAQVGEPPGREWYVLLIEPQQEVKVYTQLKSYQLNVYLPLVPHVTTRGVRRTKVPVFRPMMRGYLFVDAASLDAGMAHIERQPAIHRFLQFGDSYATVADAVIDRVRHIEQELARPKTVQSIWSVDEVVRISDGPFAGLNATITDLANGRRIRVDIALMRRAVSTTMDASQLEKL